MRQVRGGSLHYGEREIYLGDYVLPEHHLELPTHPLILSIYVTSENNFAWLQYGHQKLFRAKIFHHNLKCELYRVKSDNSWRKKYSHELYNEAE